MAVLSVADQFVNYYEYHQNKHNQLIHFIFVPVILLSFIMLLGLVHVPIISTPSEFLNLFVGNAGFIAAVPLVAYYFVLDREAGAVILAEIVGFVALSTYLQLYESRSTFYFIAFLSQVCGWGFQFFGHGFFEGRRPALFDNILQTLIAPLFVVIEAFFFLGLKSDLKKQVEDGLSTRNARKQK
ncbi:endoplasmic reticulum membrane protein [Acrasis kona]|uniref:Endoplasmic reticulum membrane protein n=1 Tax=Acrasis kona TaxID=1008807 RepID=A0AAW2Z3J4_9EUKA